MSDVKWDRDERCSYCNARGRASNSWFGEDLFLYLLIYFEVRHSAVSLNDQPPVERVNNFPAE